MTTYQIDYIVEQVRIIMDQNQWEGSVVNGETNTLQLDDIIRRCIKPAAEDILLASPREVLGTGITMPIPEGAFYESDREEGVFYLQLPDDYLRLAMVQLSSWRIPLIGAIPDSSPLFVQAQSRFSGISGNPIRPLAFETTGVNGERVLALYRGVYGDAIYKAQYFPTLSKESDEIIFPAALLEALLYQIAGLAETTLGDAQLSTSFLGIARNTLVQLSFNELSQRPNEQPNERKRK